MSSGGTVTVSKQTVYLLVVLGLMAIAIAVLTTVLLANSRESAPSEDFGEQTATPTESNPQAQQSLAGSVTTSAEVTATPTAPPTATQEPAPAATVLAAAPVATATPFVPTSTPTVAASYASVDLKSDWDAFVTAATAMEGTGVRTYQQAVGNSAFRDLLTQAASRQGVLVGHAFNLLYNDSCRSALVAQGGLGPDYLFLLKASLTSIVQGGTPTGQAGWNQAVSQYQPPYVSWLQAVEGACEWQG